MTDLSTHYMGLTLSSPIIVGSCGLTGSADSIKKLEKNGAAAVVLKSLFEEQIMLETESLKSDVSMHTEEMDYIRGYTRQNHIDQYLKLIADAKKATAIPIIASVNCISASEWTYFAGKIQDAGADALELNVFLLPGDIRQSGEEIEKTYFDIIREVKKQVTIPIAVKLGFYFTAPAKIIYNISVQDVAAIVMFNRFFRPDIDLEKLELTSASIFSSPQENALPLRWIGLLSGTVDCDLAATTGVYDGNTVLKNLLVGAKAVQVVSAVYKEGPQIIGSMRQQIEEWMQRHRYQSISDIVGKLSYRHVKDPVMYERTQFMRYFSNAD